MKVIYEFNGEDDRDELRVYQYAHDFYCALHNISEILRKYSKYIENPNIYDLIDEIGEEVFNSKMNEIP